MAAVSAAFALLSGAIGAGFASGQEIMCFFAPCGAMAGAAMIAALAALCFFFLRLPAQLCAFRCSSLGALCRLRFGQRLGRVCSALFFLLCAVTGGAMLAACAELAALTLPAAHAYGAGLVFSLVLAVLLAAKGLSGLALPGMLLAALLPVMLLRLNALPAGEACFLPAPTPVLPVRAVLSGTVYGALNAALLSGLLPALLALSPVQRRRTAALFSLLFGFLLFLGNAVCQRHLPALASQPMPFVYLSRALGRDGYFFLAACLYTASFSTLLAMLAGLSRLCGNNLLLPPACCLLFARAGFVPIVKSAYPVLGALCAGLLLLLCLPADMRSHMP